MKKIIVIGILCIVMIFIITGCKATKKPLNGEEFTQIAEKHELTVVDVKEQFSENPEIETALVAAKIDKWQIEHYQLATKDDAKKMFEKNKTTFEELSKDSKKETKIEIGNYTKYTSETDDYFMLLSRVDNTFLYVRVPIEYKEDAIAIIKDLGY